MIRKNATSAIGMLLGLLIVSVIFIVMMPVFKDAGGGGMLGKGTLDKKSVESRVDQQVKEIENIRRQNAEEMDKLEQQDY